MKVKVLKPVARKVDGCGACDGGSSGRGRSSHDGDGGANGSGGSGSDRDSLIWRRSRGDDINCIKVSCQLELSQNSLSTTLVLQ